MAIAAANDVSLSLGLPDELEDRAARVFRFLNRFHGDGVFYLPYRLLADAIGVKSPETARTKAWKLVALGALKNEGRGNMREASEWRWLGPA